MTLLEGILWLTLNIYHEARSEPQIGQVAIAHVTLNRAKQQKVSIRDVIRQPKQFHWIDKKTYFPTDFPAFFQCMQSALVAFGTSDFTAGATHFHAKSVKPQWSHTLTYIDQYGSHKFYR